MRYRSGKPADSDLLVEGLSSNGGNQGTRFLKVVKVKKNVLCWSLNSSGAWGKTAWRP